MDSGWNYMSSNSNDIAKLVAQLAVLATKAPAPECLTDHNRTNMVGSILEVGPVIRACITCSWNTASIVTGATGSHWESHHTCITLPQGLSFT
jgi:hypothetical protein